MTTPAIGIHDLSMATTHYVLDLAVLADRRGQPAEKFTVGLGQESMSFPAGDEDIVTMAAAAAAPIIERHGVDNLSTVLLATESGVDESKAAALYLHRLIGLPSTARVVELKQACYAGTAALQFAAGLVAAEPNRRVLVIVTDIARYEIDSAAEVTQGAAAVAMLISADPAILRMEPVSGIYSEDLMDFWRPTYRSTAIVDGQYSVAAYLKAIEMAWTDYRKQGGRELSEFRAFCYHQPFTKMAYKAHRHLVQLNNAASAEDDIHAAIEHTLTYNRVIGNSYTASMYVGLISLLDHAEDLTDQPIAFISYGSGCVAEYFAATVVPGYRSQLRTAANRAAIERRRTIPYKRYRELHERQIRPDGSDQFTSEENSGAYRLVGHSGHRRIYEMRSATSRRGRGTAQKESSS
ncbi:hydroxymethylglutaryl-CoA synthase [Nocardia sp. CS682]|uniref:hydroxymethylglutaryl-CoA synthase n=1 Tax=Nocardia sp. CS682 TaxID=1047172 RepID=UPI0010751E09|nr:hydroxymethylglutaryl-CoA synthase [Nocardia sp. CS682]QBS39525.1 hydroxymethylglutaryl-CoA synthase [Nocardia sp. CS682]